MVVVGGVFVLVLIGTIVVSFVADVWRGVK